MSDSQANNDDLQDRLTDRVLAEAVGGETPPDLSDAIASRFDEQLATPVARSSRGVRFTLLATAASLMLAVFLWPAWDEETRTAMQDTRQRGQSSASDGPESVEADSGFKPNSGAVRVGTALEALDDDAASVEVSDPPKPTAEMDNEVKGARQTVPERLKALYGRQLEGEASFHETDRRGGAPTVFYANPAEGNAPTTSYPPSPELRDRLQKRSQVASGRLTQDEPVAGRTSTLPKPASPPVAGVPIQLGAVPASVSERGRTPQPGSSTLSWSTLRYRRELSERFAGGIYGGNDFYYRPEPPSRDQYAAIRENDFIKPIGEDALSTFSIDVDTASYSNVRQFLLNQRRLPPRDAVRVEELVNYFDYGYAGPAADSEDPFAASMEVAACPWKPEHRLVRIGIKGREVQVEKRPLSNLVFLVDVSGSMNHQDKLPLVIAGLEALTDRLGENDRVAIVVYAGSEGVVLPSTSGDQKDAIRSALGRLQAGGSTAGGAGLKLAYEIAERNHIPGGVNRVVLCTDGDFNVGLTGTEELAQLVETRAEETRVFLTVLGFGRGNLNDAMLEAISGRGDGHYAYIDSEKEARRVLSRNLSGTLVTIAKDVKLQVEFNPAKVASYRLIGYENRVLAAKDFNDDTKDAGEIGAGHTVTALYEVVPTGIEEPTPPIDGLKYQPTAVEDDAARIQLTLDADDRGEPLPIATELLTLKIRYKQPDGDVSKKLEFSLESDEATSTAASEDFRWAAAVAEFGMRLRGSRHVGEGSFDTVLERARGAVGTDEGGCRAEFLDMVRRASELSGR
ncbi:MAG: von Willebrand factor type A domain-containing protein [Planctomycetota bacterium]